MISETVRRAQAGDEQAFAELYGQHNRRVYALCFNMTQDVTEAEDLTQETFLRLWRSLHLFRGDSTFTTWLHRVTVNMVLMSFRKKKRRAAATVSLEDLEISQEFHRSLTVRDSQLEQVPTRLAIEHAVSELPRCQKRIFILRYFAGMNNGEVAAALHCSVGNSKAQGSRAREKVRRALRSKRTPLGVRF